MAGYRDCLGIFNTALGKSFNELTEAEKTKVLDTIGKKIDKEKKIVKETDLENKIKQFLSNESTKEEVRLAIEQRERLFNIQATERILSHLGNFKDRALGLRSLLVGTVRFARGARKSIDAIGKYHSTKYITSMIKRMEEENIFQEFVSGKLDDAIAVELFEMRPGGKSGASGNPTAEKIARVLFELQDHSIDALNRHGAWIRKLPEYIMKQSHNPVLMRRQGYPTWYNKIKETVDMERTLEGVDPEKTNQFWRDVYTGLITGVHLKHQGADFADDIVKGFTGPSNLAKRLSAAHRIIHFKDAKSFMSYNKSFGSKSIRESIILGLEHAGRNRSLLEVLGPNPKAMLKKIIDMELKKAKAEGNIKQIEQFSKYSTSENNLLWWGFKEVDGTTRIPGNATAAHWSSTIRNIQNMAKLGMATISSLTDVPNQVAELKYQGINRFKGYSIAFENIMKGRGMKGSDRRKVAQMLGVGFDGIIGNTLSRFSANDLTPGMFAKAQQSYFKLNLLSPWTDSHRVGVTFMMSKRLGEQANRTFDKLDPETQRILQIYDIGAREWDLVISKSRYKGEDGNTFIVTDALEALDDATILAYLKAKEPLLKKHSASKVARTKDRLVSALGAYYVDRADFAVPMPSAAERAIMNMGTQDGTPLGIAVRLIAQFKSFPITVLHKSLGREIYGYGAESLTEGLVKGKGSLTGMAHFIAGTSILGYMSLYLKDIMRGKEPRHFTDDKAHNAAIIAAAMAQGGGLGLYGDFLFGQFNRFGRSALATLMGPTIGEFDDFVDVFQALKSGEDPFAKMAKIIQGNTPFINLFYLRIALDYLILYNIQEWQNPGYLKRLERRMLKEHDQRFYIRPSRVIRRGGDANIPRIISNMIGEATK